MLLWRHLVEQGRLEQLVMKMVDSSLHTPSQNFQKNQSVTTLKTPQAFMGQLKKSILRKNIN